MVNDRARSLFWACLCELNERQDWNGGRIQMHMKKCVAGAQYKRRKHNAAQAKASHDTKTIANLCIVYMLHVHYMKLVEEWRKRKQSTTPNQYCFAQAIASSIASPGLAWTIQWSSIHNPYYWKSYSFGVSLAKLSHGQHHSCSVERYKHTARDTYTTAQQQQQQQQSNQKGEL